MKNTIIITLSAILFSACDKEENPGPVSQLLFECYDAKSFGELRPADYDGLPTSCMNTVLDENFEAQGDWYKRNDSEYRFNVSNGKYDMESKINSNFYTYYSRLFSGTDNFQIEARLDFVEWGGNDSNSGLTWGGAGGLDGLFYVGITNDGRFKVGHIKNNTAEPELQPLAASPSVLVDQPNHIMIRVWEQEVFVFINQQLVFRSASVVPYGNELGFKTGAFSKVQVDWLRLDAITL